MSLCGVIRGYTDFQKKFFSFYISILVCVSVYKLAYIIKSVIGEKEISPSLTLSLGMITRGVLRKNLLIFVLMGHDRIYLHIEIPQPYN